MKRSSIQMFLIAIVIVFSNVVVGQDLRHMWSRSFGGSISEDITSIAVDDSMNIYVTGYFTGTTDFDPGPGTYNLTSFGNLSNDVYVAKYSKDGYLFWAKQFGGALEDMPFKIVRSATGYLYITGHFQGQADFDPDPFQNTYRYSAGLNDGFILKLNNAGGLSGVKTIGGTGNDDCEGICLDNSGNAILTGFFSNTVNFGSGNVASVGGSDIFIMKLSATLSLSWAKTIGSTTNDSGVDIKLDLVGKILVVGSYSGNADFNPSSTLTYYMTSYPVRDVFIECLYSNGGFAWAKRISGVDIQDVNCINIDLSNNIYLGGQFYSNTNFDTGSNAINDRTSSGGADGYILKLTNSGDFIWVYTFGGLAHEDVFSIEIDSLFNVYASGSFEDSVNFNTALNPNVHLAVGQSDAYILSLDQYGEPNFVKSFGSSKGDFVFIILKNEYIYSGGGHSEKLDADPGYGVYSIPWLGSVDCLLQKYKVVKGTRNLYTINCKIEGYYLTGGGMVSKLNNTGITTDNHLVDSIVVQLRHVSNYSVVEEQKEVLYSDGTINVEFLHAGYYYICIRSRNGVETWSKLPVLITNGSFYSFSTL